MNNTLGKLITDWNGTIEAGVETNMQSFTSVEAFLSTFKTFSDDTHIKLLAKRENANSSVFAEQKQHVNECDSKQVYMITVKKYMTEPASPGFDFMAKWNNNKPMPMRTMVGTIEKETRGMVYMKLHGKGLPVIRCMRCGRLLTNPTSQLYGIGPECMSKLGLVRIEIDDVDTIKQRLVDITWEGWVIKSAITDREEVNE